MNRGWIDGWGIDGGRWMDSWGIDGRMGDGWMRGWMDGWMARS